MTLLKLLDYQKLDLYIVSSDHLCYIEFFISDSDTPTIQSYQLNVLLSSTYKLSLYGFYNDGTRDTLWYI